jgi:hypothetical protein
MMINLSPCHHSLRRRHLLPLKYLHQHLHLNFTCFTAACFTAACSIITYLTAAIVYSNTDTNISILIYIIDITTNTSILIVSAKLSWPKLPPTYFHTVITIRFFTFSIYALYCMS